MFRKILQFIIILPIIILLLVSSYIGYSAWQKYKINTNLKSQLNHTKLLQSFEHSILNEIVCVATMSEHKDLIAKVCNKTKQTTDELILQITQTTNDRSLENILRDIRSNIKDSGVTAVEKLVNGDLDKKIKKFLKNNTIQLKNYSNDLEEKNILQLYGKVSDISYATEAEKALVSYYLSLNKQIPAKNLIYWGDIVSSSELLEIDNNQAYILNEQLQNIWKDDKLQETLRHIEDIRMDLMSHASTGNYNYDVAEWVTFINKKQKVLNHVESLLLNNILDSVNKRIGKKLLALLFAIGAILLSLLALFLFIINQRKTGNQHKQLNDLLTKVHTLSSDTEPLKNLKDNKNQTLAFDYIGSKYKDIYEKEKESTEEIKMKNEFFNNILYEMRTPLDRVFGYTKLLKETSLSKEQSDYNAIIENSSERLGSILNHVMNRKQIRPENHTIKQESFNIIKAVESIVETFAIKADQKDIVLGAYIDPSLPEKVIGDEIRLSQILTTLLRSSLALSKTYNSVDVMVEKIHTGNKHSTIKFLVKNSSVSLSKEKIATLIETIEDPKETDNLPVGVDMNDLSITNSIIKRMGGKLNIESKTGGELIFSFTFTLDKDQMTDNNLYPRFEGLKVGLVLPSKEIDRQIDKNLESYVKYLGAEFKVYYQDTLFGTNKDEELPDLMLVYHHYARLEGELERFSNLDCNTTLITSGTLRARIDSDKYNFSNIVYGPITINKAVRILAKDKLEHNSSIEKISHGDKKFENIHALLIEDNEVSQKLMKYDLEKFGIEVSIASNGKKAFELRRDNNYDILFMDIDMPVMDGIEATKKILYHEGINQLKHVPIIALTVNTVEENNEKYLNAGMDDSISKPFDPVKIEEIIQKYCIELVIEREASEEDDLIAKVLSDNFIKE